MTGKIRVSIVATALDGHKSDNKTVLNMFSRVQNRNSGYSDNLFSQNTRVETNTLSSIDGATALKLDESFELDKEEENNSINEIENRPNINFIDTSTENNQISNNFPTGVSIESASYMENNTMAESDEIVPSSNSSEAEYTPKLFSEEHKSSI